MDEIRKRYGEDCVQRAVFVGNRIPHMSGGIDKVKRNRSHEGRVEDRVFR